MTPVWKLKFTTTAFTKMKTAVLLDSLTFSLGLEVAFF